MNDTKKDIDSAEQLSKEGNYEAAIAILEEVYRANPENESAALMSALAFYDSGKIDEAVARLEKLLEKELQRQVFTGFAFDELTRILKKQKNYLALLAVCEKAATSQPEDPGLLQELGHAYLHAHKAKEACRIFERLVALDPANAFFYRLLGEALFAAGLVKESETAFLRAAEIDKQEADKYFFRSATLWQNAGQYGDAQRLIELSIAHFPDNPLYYCFLGDVLVARGELNEAFAAYDLAASCDQDRADTYYNRLGNSLMKANYFSEAAQAFQAALAHVTAYQYYLNLAAAHRAMGENHRAAEIQAAAAQLQKGSAD